MSAGVCADRKIPCLRGRLAGWCSGGGGREAGEGGGVVATKRRRGLAGGGVVGSSLRGTVQQPSAGDDWSICHTGFLFSCTSRSQRSRDKIAESS